MALSGGWQISVGDVSETLRPALYVLSVAASTWVLVSARRHGGFRPRVVWAWALSTFLFPLVVLPLYLVARLFTHRPETLPNTSESEEPETDSAGASDVDGGRGEAKRSRFIVPLLYASALVLAGAAYFYRDYRSFDAHLARAARANLYGRREQTISEYRGALRVREDAYTRKLLGLELLAAGRAEEALAELRAAVRGGETDERLHLHTATLLESLNRHLEAAESYGRFLGGPRCTLSPTDTNCRRAAERLAALGGPPAR